MATGGSSQELPLAGYSVAVQAGLLQELPADLVHRVPASSYVILTDHNVRDLYALQLQERLAAAFGKPDKVLVHSIEPGEASKCRETKARIEDWMLAAGCDRQTCIVALGGGVVGDLSGFVAATFMRGIKFVQVPTSMLAMVDSSIGGKTGIDTPAGKNLVGSFYRPQRVYIDPTVLTTLPIRELRNGMAEVIKAGAIRSAELFELLELHAESIQSFDIGLLEKVILMSAKIKVDVVNEDEHESGLRAILNFGHSVGHGIEALLQPDWLHGECVAVGMVKETEIARGLGDIAPDTLNRLLACLQAYKLPVTIPPELKVDAILEKMAVDKKNQNGVKRLILLESIGKCSRGACAVSDPLIERVLSLCVEVTPSGPANATIRVPGSKSISNRVLLMAALGSGTCRIKGLLHSDDTKVMIDALRGLGAPSLQFEDNGQTLVVEGAAGKLKASKDNELFLSNAGTASRFLTTACALAEGDYSIVTGNKRMQERPIADLVDALRKNGCQAEYLKHAGCPPIKVPGGGLPGGEISLSANISSQFVSSILISAPYAKTPVHLKLVGEVVSEPYIVMTVALMRQFGVQVEKQPDGSYVIPNTGYINPEVFEVESDASSASYPLAIAAITGGKVTVESVGTESLQGDAKFCEVLRAMGCTVEQTAASTTVQGPPVGSIKAIEVDMSDVTDTFMTAAVVMASAPKGSISRITNIANQRVKECDRIAAMAKELAKCGVHAEELPDGLIIHGAGSEPPEPLSAGAGIFCYKDHRIAMSFGVLGCLWPGIRILDKDCTDKTYPSFWDDVERIFGNPVAAALPPSDSTASTKDQSIVVIGMRAAGKTTLSAAAAKALRWSLVDLDAVMEEECGGIKKFVEKEGWDAFRALETRVLTQQLELHQSKCIISCGGGVVEAAANRALLKTSGLPIVWIRRHIDDIEAFLQSDPTRPAYGESIRDVWVRRRPLYEQACTSQFFVSKGDSDLASVAQEFVRFFAHLAGHQRLILRSNTFFLSLTFADLAAVDPALLAELCDSVHAVELRVDLLQSWDHDFVLSQLALLRRASSAPVIFTVRSVPQGGKFDGTEQEYFALLSVGVQAGCAIIDVEACWSSSNYQAFLKNKGTALAIGSMHFKTPCEAQTQFVHHAQQCWAKGLADVVKLVYTAQTPSDCFVVHQTAKTLAQYGVTAPVIALLMGEQGKLSRVLNTFMTPVTHEKLPAAAAPGQLCAHDITRLRRELGLVEPKRFYIAGSAVQFSPSPLMHNTGFGVLGVPFTYHRLQTPDVAEVAKCIADPATGGLSVTMPFKQAVMEFTTQLNPAAKAIGAVNTIIKDRNEIIGDNTDWIGIVQPIARVLDPRSRKTGLILGAGGTARAACYALQQLGVARILVHNRTTDRAVDMCADFAHCEVAASMEDVPDEVSLVVSTLPPQAHASLPERILKSKPVVMDVTYIPRDTDLLKEAERSGCVTIAGIDMLIAQGVQQTSLWTMRPVVEFAPLVEQTTKHVFEQFDPAAGVPFPERAA